MRCARCHITVPSEIKVCPKCGARQWRWLLLPIGWGVLGALVAYAVFTLVGPAPVERAGDGQEPGPVVAQATAAPVEPNAPEAGTVLYQADELGGLDAFAGTAGWSYASGNLSNDGSGPMNGGWVAAPYQPDGIANYAVEADIQILRVNPDGCAGGVGLVARAGDDGGYQSGVVYGIETCKDLWLRTTRLGQPGIYGSDPIADVSGFSPGSAWHTYRLEVDGDDVRLLVDGVLMAEGQSDQFRAGGRVGLWDDQTEVNVRRFTVVAL